MVGEVAKERLKDTSAKVMPEVMFGDIRFLILIYCLQTYEIQIRLLPLIWAPDRIYLMCGGERTAAVAERSVTNILQLNNKLTETHLVWIIIAWN